MPTSSGTVNVFSTDDDVICGTYLWQRGSEIFPYCNPIMCSFTLIALEMAYGLMFKLDELWWVPPTWWWCCCCWFMWLCDCDGEWLCVCLFNWWETCCMCCWTFMCASRYEFFCSVVIFSTFTVPSYPTNNRSQFIKCRFRKNCFNFYLKVYCCCYRTHWISVISQHWITLHTNRFPFVKLF